MNPSAADFYAAFVAALNASPTAVPLWNVGGDPEGWTMRWTSEATAAIVEAIRQTFAGIPELQIAARGHPDRHGKSEYCDIDATGYDDAHWRTPVVAVEHENKSAEHLEYSAWKLLWVRTEIRVLVCYIDAEQRWGAHADVHEVNALLLPLVHDNPGRSLHMIVGSWDGDPEGPDGWGGVFSLHQVM